MIGLREYNRKIGSLKNTRKITGSMKMVSTAKLQRFTKIRKNVLPFGKAAEQLYKDISSINKIRDNKIIQGYQEISKARILLFSSDRGLCGRYNHNVIAEGMKLQNFLLNKNIECRFSFCGLKGYAYFNRRKSNIDKVYKDYISHPDLAGVKQMSTDLIQEYMTGAVHEVWLVYTKRVSGLMEKSVSYKLLPIPLSEENKTFDQNDRFLIEDPVDDIIQTTSSFIIQALIYRALMESVVSEHSARMHAMDTAETNCDRLINKYLQLRNRARQAAITTELSEIVTGKEALDG